MNDKPPDWSLKKEMEKRKTQEIIRGVEKKRISQAMDPVPSPSPKDSQNPKTTGEAKRTTGTGPLGQPSTGEVKRGTGPLSDPRTASGEAKRATQLGQAVSASRRTTGNLIPVPSTQEMVGAARARIVPILIGVVVMLIVAMALTISAGRLKINTPTPTFVTLPIITAHAVAQHLNDLGAP